MQAVVSATTSTLVKMTSRFALTERELKQYSLSGVIPPFTLYSLVGSVLHSHFFSFSVVAGRSKRTDSVSLFFSELLTSRLHFFQ